MSKLLKFLPLMDRENFEWFDLQGPLRKIASKFGLDHLDIGTSMRLKIKMKVILSTFFFADYNKIHTNNSKNGLRF